MCVCVFWMVSLRAFTSNALPCSPGRKHAHPVPARSAGCLRISVPRSAYISTELIFKSMTVQTLPRRFSKIHHVPLAALTYRGVVSRSTVRLPARRRWLVHPACLPSTADYRGGWDLPKVALSVCNVFLICLAHSSLSCSSSLGLNPAHQILHYKWSQVRLTCSALPLVPSLLSHRSALCIGICSPNHNCDIGQSRAQAHT